MFLRFRANFPLISPEIQRAPELREHFFMDPFFDLRRHAGSGHQHKAKLNIILSAIEEIIVERRGGASAEPITSTEYFAALMTALEGGDFSSAEDVLYLLSVVLPTTPAAPVRAKFRHVASIFISIGRQVQAEEGHTAMLKHLLDCLGKALQHQETSSAAWASPAHLQALEFLMSHLDDRRPKIRKQAMASLVWLMQAHRANPASPVLVRVADSSMAVLAAGQSSGEYSPCLQILGFLVGAAPLLPLERVVALTGVLYGLLGLGHSLLTAHSSRVLSAVVTGGSLPVASLLELAGHLLRDKPAASSATGGAAGWAALLAE